MATVSAEDWTEDRSRCATAGVPYEVVFATKIKVALAQIKQAQEDGEPTEIVVADLAYRDSASFRDKLTAIGIPYVVKIRSATSVCAPGTSPLPPARICTARRATRPVGQSTGVEIAC